MVTASSHIVSLSLLVSTLSYGFLYAASFLLPLFDKSPLLTSIPSLLQPILRWDSFHVFHVAHSGYIYEHEWAFFPGSPALVRYLRSASLFVVLAIVTCDSTLTLYRLSLRHLHSHSLAYMSTILFLLSTSPVTVRLVPYSEPFFTYLSYRGMLYCAMDKWLLATIMFTLASTFRSNGFFLSGFVLWGLVVHPLLATRKVELRALGIALLSTSLIFLPFIYQNYVAYTIFCRSSIAEPPWCAYSLPCIYTYSQSKYWNVGFLRYWTLSQLPNFIIALPIFLLITNFSIAYSIHHLSSTSSDATLRSFYGISILPHLIHALVLFSILLTNAHTQIALRLAPSIPLTYWSAARLIISRSNLRRHWISWSVVWGTVSIILWACFLPPA